MTVPQNFDVAIVGSSFASSILGWALARSGKEVIIIDKARHPRFAIGESSTPLADFLLEHFADEYGLRELRAMSRWGSWQAELPSLGSGMKRGFSYFQHSAGSHFEESESHGNSLLVAASASEALSDTHWLRSDVDHWLVKRAQRAGAACEQGFSIDALRRMKNDWEIQGISNDGNECRFIAKCLVDGSGTNAVVARQHGATDCATSLMTNTSAIYGHFRDVASFDDWLSIHNPASGPFPFPSDMAAQHHLIEEGWVWMLRFRDNLTSVGLVLEKDACLKVTDQQMTPKIWKQTLEKYPSLVEIMARAKLVAPMRDGNPALGWIPRVSRLLKIPHDSITGGAPWCCLPNTLGIVDPLHSTGIAHGLWGALNIADAVVRSKNQTDLGKSLESFTTRSSEELRWIDELVSMCYQAKHIGFDAFTAACCFYFVSAIHSERQLSELGSLPDGFLLNGDHSLREALLKFGRQLESTQAASISAKAKELLAPWNDAGLLEPDLNNRVSRSAAPKV